MSVTKDEQAADALAPAPGSQESDFSLRSTPDQLVSLSEFRGQLV
jgi:peroxiredoxin